MNRHGRRARRATAGERVDRRLRTQLRVFAVIFAAVAVLDVVRMVLDRVNPLWAVGGFAVGLAIGFVLARSKALGWNASEQAVVAKTDVVGAAILVAYLVFVLFFKGRIVDGRAPGPAEAHVFGLALTGGAMLGRVMFTLRSIRRVLAAVGIGIS